MATIVTRSGKGSALTHNEMDANFTNLNNDKPDSTDFRTINGTSIIGEGDITFEVEITDSVSTTSSTIAASATAVKTAYDAAVANDPIELDYGTLRIHNPVPEVSTGSLSYTKVIEYYTKESGNISISFKLRSEDSSTTVYARIYINGVAVGTERSASSGSGSTFTEDFPSISSGDFIQLYAKTSSGLSGRDAIVSDFKIMSNVLPYSTITLP